MTARKVRVAVVGVGNFGRLHALALSELPKVELIGVCDTDPRRREEVGSVLGVRKYDALETLLRETELDAVVLATPESYHVSQTIAALERGVDVLVEKPLALTAKDACLIQRTAEAQGRLVMVGTILRFSIPHRNLRSIVSAGHIGPILHLRSVRYISESWFRGSTVDAIFRACIHDIDQVLWLTSQRVVKVYAAGHVDNEEKFHRSVVGLLILERGTTAVVEAHFALPQTFPATTIPPERPGARRHLLEVIGTSGIAKLDDPAGVEVWSSNSAYRPDLSVVAQDGGRILGALRAELEHFTDCVASRHPSSIAPLADSVHGVAVAEAMARSMHSGKIIQIAEVLE